MNYMFTSELFVAELTVAENHVPTTVILKTDEIW